MLDVYRVKIKDANFSLKMRDDIDVYPANIVALNNMRFSNINADLKNVLLIDDSINVKFNRFSAKEASGFEVKSISGEFVASSKGMVAKNTRIRTTNSDLSIDVLMKTSSWDSYGEVIDSVYFDGEIKKGSYLGMKDATYWAETLKGFEQKIGRASCRERV